MIWRLIRGLVTEARKILPKMSDDGVIVLSDSDSSDATVIEEIKIEPPEVREKEKKRIKLEPAPEPVPSTSKAAALALADESNGTDEERSDSESELDLSRRKRKAAGQRSASSSKPDLVDTTSNSASEAEVRGNAPELADVEVQEIESDAEVEDQKKTESFSHKDFRPCADEFLAFLTQKKDDRILTEAQLTILEQKFRDGVNALDFSAKEVLSEAVKLVQAIKRNLVNIPQKFFGTLQQLIQYLEKMKLKQGNDKVQRKQERRIKGLVVAIEACLRRAKEYDEKEIDFGSGYDSENDVNEAYCVGDRIKKKCMRHLEEYKNLTGENYFTERALQRKIRIANVVPIEEITKAVCKYLDKLDKYCVPDIHNLQRVISEESNSKGLGLNEDQISDFAKRLMQRIIPEKKQQRMDDFEDAWSHIVVDQKEDTDLEEKLKGGDKLKRRVSDIIDEYAEKQKEVNAIAIEVPDEEAEMSAPESDDSGSDEDEDSEDVLVKEEEVAIPSHASSSTSKLQECSSQPEVESTKVESKAETDLESTPTTVEKNCGAVTGLETAQKDSVSVSTEGGAKSMETNNNNGTKGDLESNSKQNESEEDLEKDLNFFLSD